VEPADDPPGLRIADEYSERAKVVVCGLADIVGAKAVAYYCCVCSIKLIGHGDVYVCLGIVIRHIPLLVRPSGGLSCRMALDRPAAGMGVGPLR